MRLDWKKVEQMVHEKIALLGERNQAGKGLLYGQDRAVAFIARRLPAQRGVVLADEVGLGKTRVALIIADAVMACGGNVAVVVPPGLLAQWENEYMQFKMQLDESPCAVVKLRRFEDLFAQGKIIGSGEDGFPLAQVNRSRWVLISHAFGFHRVTANSAAWRVELPALVRAAYEYDSPARRNRWREYANNRGYNHTDPFSRYGQYWCAAKFLAKAMRGVFEDPAQEHFLLRNDLRPNIEGSESRTRQLIELYKKHGKGYETMLELIGHLIGDIDLLIVDEAHKSRDDCDVPEKQLGMLIEKIVRTNHHSRRLCLTATPVELDPSQWEGLLKRARLPVPRQTIEGFARSLEHARSAPDNPEMIESLIESAKRFQDDLRDFVVRRRRINQEEMRRYFDGTPGQAHPHRELSDITITFGHLDAAWRKATLAFEGQGLAAKGVRGLDMRERLLDIRHAHGLINDFSEEETGSAENETPKGGRRRTWGKIAAAATGISSNESWLMAHPRVQAAADHIERQLCILGKETGNREKYLVFGRFSAPMKALSKELNARYLLRCLDFDLPVPPGGFDEDELFSCYKRIMALRESDSGQRGHICFSGKLSDQRRGFCLTKEDLQRLITDARKRHEAAREYVAKVLDRDYLSEHLPGNDAINQLADGQRDSLFSLIRLDVYMELANDLTDPDQRASKAEMIRNAAVRIWARYLEQIIEGMDLDLQHRTGTEWRGDDDYRDIDAKGDLVDPAHLAAALELHDSGETRQSSLCRILDGNVTHKTRKILQAQFNEMIFPRVLIAQSIVGREGLNLHKRCRRVLLFHPEWNPAVVEQQIGRVDRIGSLWTQMADEWLAGGKVGPIPKIAVEYLVFEGTYDAYQYQVLRERRHNLNSQLFGELLDYELMQKVHPGKIEALLEAVPSFEP